jgi:hypothetical protein
MQWGKQLPQSVWRRKLDKRFTMSKLIVFLCRGVVG